ncbi:MAG: type IX secretion system membrane protein PorP/SprF [Adhaeribacter sp.]
MRILLSLAAFLFSTALYAQQNPQYTQYIFNGMIVNPAYTGSKEVVNVNVMHRTQWTGMPGAPNTQTFSVDGTTKNNRIGLGAFMIHDRIGSGGKYSLFGNAAVKLPVSETGVLSLGLSLGAYRHYIHGNEVHSADPNDPTMPIDPSVPQDKEFVVKPDLRTGIYYHTERFYAGLSVANLIYFRDTRVIEPQRHYYLTSGYVFDLSPTFKFKPSFLLKEDFNGPTNVDLNMFLLFQDVVWLGGSYRTAANVFKKPVLDAAENLAFRDAVAAIIEIYPAPRLRIGYSYDIMLNKLKNLNTHEISLGYMFFKKQDTRMLTPQYF